LLKLNDYNDSPGSGTEVRSG